MESLPFELPKDIREKFSREYRSTWERDGVNGLTLNGLALDMFKLGNLKVKGLVGAAFALADDLIEAQGLNAQDYQALVALDIRNKKHPEHP
jgi:hypothetical protein